MNDRLTVAAGQGVIHIALTAQLQCHREAAHRDRKALAEALLQLPPDQRKALIKRLAARVGGQQAGLRTQITRQWLDFRPGLWRGVQVLDRFKITVQVQHHVGITGQTLQGQAQRVQLRRGGLGI